VRAGDTVRFTNVTTLDDRGVRLGWVAGGRKPNRQVYVALILGVERHPDDLGENPDFDALYASGVLLDPTRALRELGLILEPNEAVAS